jgi:hypothetical protein
MVKEQGLDLRFGASTLVSWFFCMAPLSALFVVLFYGILRQRDVPRERALLLGFGTPIFYRTAHLSHNMFLMITTFGCFWLLCPRPADALPLSPKRVYWAGFLGGWCLALDYAGVIPLLCLYAYLILERALGGSVARDPRIVPLRCGQRAAGALPALHAVVDVRQPLPAGSVLDAGHELHGPRVARDSVAEPEFTVAASGSCRRLGASDVAGADLR